MRWPKYWDTKPDLEGPRQALGNTNYREMWASRMMALFPNLYHLGFGRASQTAWVLGERNPFGLLDHESEIGQEDPTRN